MSVEIYYGSKFANEIRKEGVEKTVKKWEEWTRIPLSHEFSSSGGLTVKESYPKINSQGITATDEFMKLVREKSET